MDLSSELLEALREKLARHPHGDRVRLVQSLHGEVPLEDGSIDAATLGNFLHELDDPAAYLRDVHRALAPGGRILVADWDLPTVPPPDAERVGPPYDHRIPEARARELLSSAGFEAVESHPGFRDAYLLTGGRPAR